MAQSATVGALAAALASAQGTIKSALKTADNDHLKKPYATLNSVWEACSESLRENGFAVVQGGEVHGAITYLKTTLLHTSGEWIDGLIPLTAITNKMINEMQGLGSAITYARRYGLAAICGVRTEDDDGQASGPPARREQRRDDRCQTAPANGHGDRQAVNEQFAPRKSRTWQETLTGAVAHWTQEHPIPGEPGKIAISRRKRLINGLVSWGIKERLVEEHEVTDADGVRDAGKAARIAAELYAGEPKAVRKQISQHIADAIAKERDGAKAPTQRNLPSPDPTLPPVPRQGDAYEEFDETLTPTEAN